MAGRSVRPTHRGGSARSVRISRRRVTVIPVRGLARGLALYDPHASERDVHPTGKPVHHARAAAQRIGGGRRRRARRRRALAVSSRARGWRAGRVRSPVTSGPAQDARTRMAGSWRCSFWLRCWLLHSGARVDREIHPCPGGELGRLPACHLVCERNAVTRIRTQIGMSLEVGKRGCDLRGPREET